LTEAPPGRRFLPLDADRSRFLGASDVAAVLGLSKWKTPLATYLQKRGEAPETPTSPVMEWGNRLEDAVRTAYFDKVLGSTNFRVLPGEAIGRVVAPEVDWMVCSPDGIVVDSDDQWLYGLECKTADRAVAHLWGDSGTDQVPDAYALQCHYSMYVTGLDRWDVAVLIGGNDFRTYTLRRSDELLNLILPDLAAFWLRVETGTPPEPVAADNPLMAKLFQQRVDDMIEGDETINRLATALASAKEVLATDQEQVDELEAKLKAVIGEKAGAVGPWGKISWKQNRASEVVDWKAVARDAGATEVQIAAHTSVRSGARPFRVTFTGGAS
ncbi:MAG: YqaJ viral recombinase family protein, partial [Gemmatimonadales bacterium]